MSSALFDPILAQKKITQEILVGFSGGKDSCAVLDLCFKHFKKVQPFFMYQVPNLSFQEKILRWYENKYEVKILRLPHFETSNFLRYGTYRNPDLTVPIISTLDMYNYLRNLTGLYWIAGGERIADSIVRRAMIKNSSSIDIQRGRFYPLAYWNKQDVLNYCNIKKLLVAPEEKKLGYSFRSLDGKSLSMLKNNYPKDYNNVLKIYPLAEAAVLRFEKYGD